MPTAYDILLANSSIDQNPLVTPAEYLQSSTSITYIKTFDMSVEVTDTKVAVEYDEIVVNSEDRVSIHVYTEEETLNIKDSTYVN